MYKIWAKSLRIMKVYRSRIIYAFPEYERLTSQTYKSYKIVNNVYNN